MKIKLAILIGVFFITQKKYSQFTDVINSNRPSESVSAFSVGKKVFQAEGGIGFINEKHSILDYKANGLYAESSLRYGLFFEQLEFTGDFLYQKDTYQTDFESKTRNGLKEATLGAKFLVFDPYKNYEKKINIYSWKANHKFKWRQLVPAIAIYGGINLNFNSSFVAETEKKSVISPKVMLVTQNIFPDGYVLITNIFMEKLSTDRESIAYLITLTKGINEKWSAFIENKGIKGNLYSDGIFSGGAAYLVTKDFQVDVSISKNYKYTPSLFYGGFGASWRFIENYKEVKLKKPKNQSKTDKKMEKLEEKKKKRNDEIKLENP